MTKDQTLKQKVILYDPHPGIGGAVIPLPEPLRRVAHELDGQTLTLEEAVQRFNAVANKKSGVVKLGEYCILYLLGHNYGGQRSIHGWRLLRYRLADE